MGLTSYLPNDPASLSRLEWWLWSITAVMAILVILGGAVAREVGRYRGTIIEQRLARALEEGDAKARQLEQMASKSHAAAESARQEAERLRERVQPRIITDDQERAFLKMLAQGPSGSLDTTFPLGDAEAEALANRLGVLLKMAGWRIHPFAEVFATGPIGLSLVIHSPEKAPKYALALQDALGSIGLPAPARINSQRPEGSLALIVGHKPSK